MKSFKKFLIEVMTTAATTSTTQGTSSSKAQSGPYMVPGGTPTLPGGWPYKPQGKPQDKPQDKPEDSDDQDMPPLIDWDELDDRIQDAIEEAERIVKAWYSMTWDAFVLWLFNNYGINIATSSDYINFILDRDTDIWDWFFENYPNATDEQYETFQERLSRFRRRIGDIINPPAPGTTGSPLGGADDPRYKPFDLQDPTTWGRIYYFDPDFYRGRGPGYLDPSYEDDQLRPYPGHYVV
jgi:hypothetical protein